MIKFQKYMRLVIIMLLVMSAGEAFSQTLDDIMTHHNKDLRSYLNKIYLHSDKNTVTVGNDIAITTSTDLESFIWCHFTWYYSKTDSTKDQKIKECMELSSEFLAGTTFYYTPTQVGTYYVVVEGCLHNKITEEDIEPKVTTSVKVEVMAPQQVTLTTDVSEVDAGQTVTLTASTDGGHAKYTYYYSTDGGQSYNVIASNSSASTCEYKPSQAGNYLFKVAYTAYGLNVESEPVSVTSKAVEPYLTSLVSPKRVTTDTPVTIKATPVCYTPESYTYSYSVDGSEYTLLATTSNNQYSFTPETSGTYTFKVSAGDKETISSSVTVVDRKMLLTNMSPTVAACEEIVLISNTEDFSPTSMTYYYKRGDGDWTAFLTTDSKFISYTPTQAGTYFFKVVGTDGTYSVTSNEVSGEVTAITPKMDIATSVSDINTDNFQKGDEVTLTVTPICCTPESYTYSYSVDGSEYKEIATTSSNKCTFKLLTSGTYTFKVTSGTVTATKSFKVKDFVATLTAQETWIEATDTVHLSVTVENFTPTYLIYYYKKDDGDWNDIESVADCIDARSRKYVPTQFGVYQFKVEASDGIHTTTSNEVRVEVAAITPKVKIAASATSVLVGDTITLTATPICCTPVTYDFYYNINQTNVDYEFIERSTEPTCKFVPKSVGTYILNVEATCDDNNIYNAYTDIITVGARPTQTLTTNAIGVLSCTAAYPLDFSTVSGLRAYVATGVTSSVVTLQRVNKVQQGEAFIVSGEASTDYVVTSVPTFTHADGYTNLFKSADGVKKAEDYATFVYCLNSSGYFQQVDDPVVIPSGKAYLTTSSAAAKLLTLSFGSDEATAIGEVSNGLNSLNSLTGKYLHNGRLIIVRNGKEYNINGVEIK